MPVPLEALAKMASAKTRRAWRTVEADRPPSGAVGGRLGSRSDPSGWGSEFVFDVSKYTRVVSSSVDAR